MIIVLLQTEKVATLELAQTKTTFQKMMIKSTMNQVIVNPMKKKKNKVSGNPIAKYF